MWGHKKVHRLLADLPASGPLVHTMGPIRRMPACSTCALAGTAVAGKCFLLAALRPAGSDGGLSNPGALATATAAGQARGVASGRWEYPAGGFVVGWAGGGGSWSGEAAEGGDELESFLAGEARLTILLVAAEADGSTPAALLAGRDDVERAFTWKEAPAEGGFDWLVATPRAQDATFTEIRLGFAGNELAALDLVDAFGQRTAIRFGVMVPNARFTPETFRFVPPKGADVIGER